MKIEGKYIAEVIINFNGKKCEGILPLHEIREKLTPSLKEIIQDEVGEFGTVEVNQEYMNLYEKKEGE